MQKRSIIFNYCCMHNVGGVEKYINELVGELLLTDIRIIWLRQKGSAVAKSFEKNILDPKVEIVEVNEKRFNWIKCGKMHFDSDEAVTVVSFSSVDMGRAMYLAKKYKKYNFSILLAVPNTIEKDVYIERNFKGKLYSRISQKMSRIFKKWDDAGCLCFFNPLHIKSIEDAYSFKVENPEKKLLPAVKAMPCLNIEGVRSRALRSPFIITTVGRFDFPHKGYILGLIRAFGRIKEKYSDIKLHIIGFGPGENDVKKEISRLREEYRRDIVLYGEVAPDEISKYFENASLNISVAGGVCSGAELGLLSIPARNYCFGECEVYGFLPESRPMVVSNDPGFPVDPYIEQVINMSDEEYISKSIASYEAYKKDEAVNAFFLLEKTTDTEAVINNKDIRFLKAIAYRKKFFNLLKKLADLVNKIIRR